MTWKELAEIIIDLPEEQQNKLITISGGEEYDSKVFYYEPGAKSYGYFQITDQDSHPNYGEVVILLDNGLDLDTQNIIRDPLLHIVI